MKLKHALTVLDAIWWSACLFKVLIDSYSALQGDFYTKLRLGTLHQYESDTAYDTFAPAWNEGFCFDMQTEDGDGLRRLLGEFVGGVLGPEAAYFPFLFSPAGPCQSGP